MPNNAIVFVVKTYLKDVLNMGSDLAGAIAGFTRLPVYVPVELMKVRAQMYKTGNLNYIDELKNITEKEGLIGIYRGFWATAIREVPAYAIYFGVYDSLKNVSDN